MIKLSKRLLLIQIILMFVALIPGFSSLFVEANDNSSQFLLWCKSVDGLFYPLFALAGCSIVFGIIGLFNLGSKKESPIKMALFAEIAGIVWFICTFFVWIAMFSDPYYISYSNTVADIFVALFGFIFQLFFIAFLYCLICFTVSLHTIAYTIRSLRIGIFKDDPLVIVGLVFCFIFPLVGMILITVYESKLQKALANNHQ